MSGGSPDWAHGAKRALDLVGALLLIVCCLPLMLLLALAVLLLSGPPILHVEARLGRGGRPFTLRKFRSLRRSSGAQSSVAPEDDPRLTPLGRHLRRWRLDELPQLFNVLSGQMSLIGPRPLPPDQAAHLPAEMREQLWSVRPGLSGAGALAFLADDAFLAGRPDARTLYLSTVLPQKVRLELDYLADWRLRDDLVLALRTARQVWSPAARRESRERLRRLVAEHRSRPTERLTRGVQIPGPPPDSPVK